MLESLQAYFQEQFDSKDPLLHWRKKSWERLIELGWPKGKQEAFQYIPLKQLKLPRPASQGGIAPDRGPPFQIAFVDGFFSQEHSRMDKRIVCLPLDQAMRSYGVFLQNR